MYMLLAPLLIRTWQIELGRQYKFRLILDETWSFGVLGRTGRGITEHQNVDAAEVDMIVGSLAGPLCAGGGFCAGSDAIVEHQRISASAYTFSAALPAMLATTASEVLSMLQTSPEMLTTVRENIRTMWAQLDPRSDWVHCTSSVENPIMILALKSDLIASKKLGMANQEQLFQEVVDEVGQMQEGLANVQEASLISCLDVGEWCTDNEAKEHAASNQCNEQGHWMGASAGAEGLRHLWAFQKGD